MDHRLANLLVAALLSAAGSASAQDVVNVRVFTEPEGARYTVDGQNYSRSMTFRWQRGSKHILSIPVATFTPGTAGTTACGETGGLDNTQFHSLCRVRYGFSGWESDVELPTAGILTQTVVADPALTFLKATFQQEYRVDIAMMERPLTGSIASCQQKAERPADPRPGSEGNGVVFISGRCVDYAGSIWLPPGEITLQAIPLAGYAFSGWSLDTVRVEGALTTYTVRGPAVLAPRFVRAKRVQLLTDPVGLRVRVDRADVLTIDPADRIDTVPVPGYYDWAPGSKNLLGAPTPQTDQVHTGQMWVFDSWSNGGGQDMVYVADEQTNKPEALIAKFIRGVSVLFLTEPRGLRLTIDGREDWPSYTFVWGRGSRYQFSAPPEQLDASGRNWFFKGWKHGGPAAQEIVIDDKAIASGGVYRTAVYEAVPQVSFESSVPGIKVRVNGASCTTPCRIDGALGTEVRVSVPASVAVSDASRYEFTGWNDGSARERTVTIASDHQVYRANYRQMNRLATAVNPPQGGSVVAEPASPDGFYPGDATVNVKLTSAPGFRFRKWEGDLGGAVSSGVLSMAYPRSLLAVMDRVPHLGPSSVQNAAGPTPVPGVAPGSLITITGASLAAVTEAGPANPMAQSLGGVAVMLGDRILPLAYVSPEQINALLPSDVLPGSHRITVRPQSGLEVSREFEVAPNAPGLFAHLLDSKPYAAALREDGSAVSPENRAKRDEVVTLLGTGFGPYNRPVVDGFPIPPDPRYDLLETPEIFLAGQNVSPEWAGAAPGYNGLTAVRLRIPVEAGGDLELWVSIAGAESNRVILPVE
jgi:uncharacterized protein (TIGR03437 family)